MILIPLEKGFVKEKHYTNKFGTQVYVKSHFNKRQPAKAKETHTRSRFIDHSKESANKAIEELRKKITNHEITAKNAQKYLDNLKENHKDNSGLSHTEKRSHLKQEIKNQNTRAENLKRKIGLIDNRYGILGQQVAKPIINRSGHTEGQKKALNSIHSHYASGKSHLQPTGNIKQGKDHILVETKHRKTGEKKYVAIDKEGQIHDPKNINFKPVKEKVVVKNGKEFDRKFKELTKKKGSLVGSRPTAKRITKPTIVSPKNISASIPKTRLKILEKEGTKFDEKLKSLIARKKVEGETPKPKVTVKSLPKKSEVEKKETRSRSMLGNKNAFKGKPEIPNKHGLRKISTDNLPAEKPYSPRYKDEQGNPLHGIYLKEFKNSTDKIVINNGHLMAKYKYPKIKKTFSSPMVNDENLHLVGGWTFDDKSNDKTLIKRIIEKKKPAGFIIDKNLNKIKKLQNEAQKAGLETKINEEIRRGETFYELGISQKGTFGDHFNIDNLIKDYESYWKAKGGRAVNTMGDLVDVEKIKSLKNKKISDFLSFDYAFTDKTAADNIITGLMLGYPPETTFAIGGLDGGKTRSDSMRGNKNAYKGGPKDESKKIVAKSVEETLGNKIKQITDDLVSPFGFKANKSHIDFAEGIINGKKGKLTPENFNNIFDLIRTADNKHSRSIFTKYTGVDLPKTQSGTKEKLKEWAAGIGKLDFAEIESSNRIAEEKLKDKEKAAKQKELEADPLHDFHAFVDGDKPNMNAREKRTKELSAMISYDGSMSSKKKYLEDRIGKGFLPEAPKIIDTGKIKRLEKKLKGTPKDAKFGEKYRTINNEIENLRSNPSKPEYRLYKKGTTQGLRTFSDINKTEYDYAKYLLSKKDNIAEVTASLKSHIDKAESQGEKNIVSSKMEKSLKTPEQIKHLKAKRLRRKKRKKR